jgi:hypothetical protein
MAMVLIGAGVWYYQKYKTKIQDNSLGHSQNLTSTSVTLSTISHVTIDTFGDYQGHSFRDIFTDTSTKTTITFKDVPLGPGGGPASGNMSLYMFLNQKKIGEVGVGPVGSEFGFSPDSKYFGWETRFDSGCCHFSDSIDVINVASGTLIEIRVPDAAARDNAFVESYTWEKGAINFVVYSVSMEEDQKYYPTSPKQIWQYDLNLKTYTLLQTLE